MIYMRAVQLRVELLVPEPSRDNSLRTQTDSLLPIIRSVIPTPQPNPTSCLQPSRYRLNPTSPCPR
jgi:hypothetical protein